eukprot:COSAG05_NODE_7990_length_748_cov_1.104777_1_plen_23_part_01
MLASHSLSRIFIRFYYYTLFFI